MIFPPPYPAYISLPEDKEKYEFCLTGDPGFTTKMASDNTGIVICGYDTNNFVWVELAKRYKVTVTELIKLIYALDNEYHFAYIGLERCALTEAIKDTLELLQLHENYRSIAIQPIQTSNVKDAKARRIAGLSGYFDAGIIKLKTNDDDPTEDLKKELMYYASSASQKDDVLDALAMQPLIHIWGGDLRQNNAKNFTRKRETYLEYFQRKHRSKKSWYGYY